MQIIIFNLKLFSFASVISFILMLKWLTLVKLIFASCCFFLSNLKHLPPVKCREAFYQTVNKCVTSRIKGLSVNLLTPKLLITRGNHFNAIHFSPFFRKPIQCRFHQRSRKYMPEEVSIFICIS